MFTKGCVVYKNILADISYIIIHMVKSACLYSVYGEIYIK